MLSSLKSRASATGYIKLALRILQFVFAITVAGLYGTDLDAARKAHVAADSRWVFAVVVAGLAGISVFIYFIHFVWLAVWDFVIFVLWAAVFGVFGRMYIHEHPTPHQAGLMRMKNAVWIDLVNMLLWFVTLVWGVVAFFTREKRSLHTGRAVV